MTLGVQCAMMVSTMLLPELRVASSDSGKNNAYLNIFFRLLSTACYVLPSYIVYILESLYAP